MHITLKTGRDRVGHTLAVLLLFAAVASAGPGNYKAQRFDVAARAANGDLDVTESITFEFQSGTFTKVWRDIPESRTDGIRVLEVRMDGRPITAGDGEGHYRVSGGGRTRVEWRFAETGPSVHRFDLHYVALGVVYSEAGADVVRWRALPQEHRYRIDASRIEFEPAAQVVVGPETHRVASTSVRTSNEAVTIEATGISTNGWLIAALHYPAGQLAAASEPAWRARERHVRDVAPKWGLAAVLTFAVALFPILLLRRDYDSPGGIERETTTTAPPQALPAALASLLTARGGVNGYQPMGTLLDLADRGVLEIRETAGAFRTRRYTLCQVPGTHDLSEHETEVITTAFAGHGDDVPMSKARGRLARGGRRFREALNDDMDARGLLDPARRQARTRLMTVALVILAAGGLGMFGAAAFVLQYQGWPFLVPAAAMLAGLIGVAIAASATPLSDEGLVEAARWRGFRRHLKSIATGGEARVAPVPTRWIVYAIAMGLASPWSRYLKRNPGIAPPWFVAARADDGTAFAAFLGSHAASATGGAGGGGAAGGGGSGAG